MDHVNIETAKRLKDLGAFEGRKWNYGDWVHSEYVGMNFVADERYIKAGVPKSTIFLPRLGDCIDAVESLCSTAEERGKRHIYLVPGAAGSGAEWQCTINDATERSINNATRCGKGATHLEAAANCLIDVLEKRKEDEDA